MLNSKRYDGTDQVSLLQNDRSNGRDVRAHGIEDDASQDSIVDTIERGYARFRQGLYAFIADVTGKELGMGGFPAWLAFVQEIVLILQYTHFAFFRAIDIQWHSYTARVVSWILNAASKYPSPDTQRDVELYLAYAVPAAYLVFGLLTFMLHRHFKWPHLMPIFGYVMLLIPGVLFIPTATAHAKLFFGCFAYKPSQSVPNPFYDNFVCWESTHIVASVLSFLTMTVWMATTFVVLIGWCSYDIPADLNSRDLTAASTRTVEWFDRWIVMILLALFTGIHNTTGRYPLSIIMLLAGTTIAVANVRYLPYYGDELQSLVVYRGLSLAFAGFVSLLATIIGTSDDSTAVLLFAAGPVFVVLAILMVRARYAFIEGLSAHELSEPYLFELRSRCILRRWVNTERSDGAYGYLEDTPERVTRRRIAHETAEKLLQDGVARFPHSAQLNVWLGLFYVCVYDNGVLGYGALQAAAASNPGFDMRFLLYLYKRTLDAQISATQSAEVRSYIEFKTRKELAEAAVVEAAKRLVDFWSHLLRSMPDVDLLANQGHLARQAMSLATSHYEKLLTINPNSVPVLRSYGTFALDILGDVSKSAMLYERAEDVEHNRISSVSDSTKKGEFLQILETNLDIFDERNGVIGITVERSSLGTMESVSPSARRMLGYNQATDMVGKNVSMACPAPIDAHHDRFLSDFIMRKTGRIINQTRMTFACHRAGHILPVNLFVRWSDAANGKILGVIQEVPLVHDCHLMVDPKTSIVTYMTPNCYAIFGILRRQLIARELRLPDILPALFDPEDADRTERNWDQLSSRAGLETDGQHLIKHTPIRIHAWSMRVAVHEDEIMFVRVLILDRSKRASLAESGDPGIDDDGSQSEGVEDDDEDDAAPALMDVDLQGDAKRNQTVSERLRRHQADNTTLTNKARDDRAKLLDGPGSETAEQAFARRRKKRSDGNMDAQSATGESASQGTGSSTGGANRAFNHKRLSKAIHNVNKWTSKRLERMTYSMLVVVLLLIGSALAYHFITAKYIQSVVDHLFMARYSGTRAYVASRVTANIRKLSLMSIDSREVLLGSTEPNIVPEQTVYLADRIEKHLSESHWAMSKMSELVEQSDMNTMGKAREDIYIKRVIDLVVLVGDTVRTDKVGLQELGVRFNGAALRNTYAARRNLDRFAGYFTEPSLDTSQAVIPINDAMDPNMLDWDSPVAHYLITANGCTSVVDAYLEDTKLIIDEMLVHAKLIPTIGIIIICLCIAVNLVVLFVLIRPSVVMIKESKAQVLAMFLDIPKNIRRTIRRRVYGVYQMMRAEDDAGGDETTDRMDDDRHDEDGHQDAATDLVARSLRNGDQSGADMDQSDRFSKSSHTTSQRDVNSWMAQRRAAAQQALRGERSDLEMAKKQSGDANNRKAQGNGAINLDSLTAAARTDANRQNNVAGSDLEAAAGNGGDLTKLSAAELAKAKAEAAETESKANQNDKSWSILLMKFGFVLAVFTAGFLVLIITSQDNVEKTNHIGRIAELALRRNSLVYTTLYALREHLFGNYAYNLANNVEYPTMVLGDFKQRTLATIEEMNALQHAIIFGSDKYGIGPPESYPLQQQMLFGNICDIHLLDDEAARLAMNPLPATFGTQCLAAFNGIFTRGIHGALLQYGLMVANIVEADTAAILAPYAGQVGNPNHAPDSDLGKSVVDDYLAMEKIILVLSDALPRTTALYFVQAISYLRGSEGFRVGMLIGFCLFVLASYLTLFLPTIRMLNTDARNTRAMMLVLPPDVVKSIPSVQLFIMENFQRRD